MTMWDDEWNDTSKLNTYGLRLDENIISLAYMANSKPHSMWVYCDSSSKV